MSPAVRRKLDTFVEFVEWLHERYHESTLEVGRQESVALATLQQAQDIGDGIACLVERGLRGPALALARPVFETYVYGHWLLVWANEDQVDRYLQDKGPKLGTIIKDHADDADGGGAWIYNTARANLKSFHSLVHGGASHYARRTSQGAIEPRYPDAEIERLLDFDLEVQMRIGFLLLTYRSDKTSLAD